MKRILIVEDETLLREMYCEELTDLGYTVTSAINGREGLEAVTRDCPDLVVSENAMPVMSGLEFVRVLRANGGRAAPPVIMVSAFSEQRDIQAAREAGVTDYCTKPVDIDRLAAIIAATVGPS